MHKNVKSISTQNTKDLSKSLISFCNASSPFEKFGLKEVRNYEWPKKGKSVDLLISDYDSKFSISGDNNYEKNVALKRLIQNKYQNRELNNRSISEWIIKEWGGIKKISKNLDEYISAVERKELPQNLSGVASYSKLFAMFYPDEFAIFDARVAVSLNIIQLLSAEKSAVFFPYLSGRNKWTGDQVNKRGFSSISHFKRDSINTTSTKTWEFIPEYRVYAFYNNILLNIAEASKWQLMDIEMLLFSQAEKLVQKIHNDKRFSFVDWSSLPNQPDYL